MVGRRGSDRHPRARGVPTATIAAAAGASASVTALVTRLRDLGASGVTVCTPLDYVGAIATYRAAGLHEVEHLRSLVRPATA